MGLTLGAIGWVQLLPQAHASTPTHQVWSRCCLRRMSARSSPGFLEQHDPPGDSDASPCLRAVREVWPRVSQQEAEVGVTVPLTVVPTRTNLDTEECLANASASPWRESASISGEKESGVIVLCVAGQGLSLRALGYPKLPPRVLSSPLKSRYPNNVDDALHSAVESVFAYSVHRRGWSVCSHPPVLLIDTAAMFIMDNSVSVLCRELRGLVDDGVVSSIVVTVHRDIAGVATMAALRDVCSGCLELRTEEGSAGRRRVRSKLHLLKSSGKIIVEECQLSIADHTVLVGQSTTVSDSTTAAADERPDTSTATVMYEGASAEQKQKPRAADAATTRPYTLTEAEQQGILDGGGGGRIFYQPDDGDDFDDEDPDDDLDI
jgi:hypothetical protein